jgi:predicted Zn finger-like uncharacterized protein
MVTRCPTCGTTFRVQRDQLTARGGRVRCGKCATAFDAVAGLVDPAAPPLRFEPSPQLSLFDPARRPPRPQPEPDDAPLAGFLAEEAPPRPYAWAWGLAAAFALLALGAQLALHFRTELALLVPEARALLDAGCRPLGCVVRLPRRPELMSIESSDLQADAAREQGIVLNALIRNRAPFPQEYPALELTLTDEADRTVVRRVLMAADYLERARLAEVAARGMAPGTELALRLHFDTGGARATGYRLYLFFP